MRDVAGGGQRGQGVERCGWSASEGSRPPRISCWVWTKNSISRMPPRPSFRSAPWRVEPLVDLVQAWIWRLIEWMSAMAAKSRLRRQMKGDSSARKALARAPRSPAAARALMKAARSQFWPTLS